MKKVTAIRSITIILLVGGLGLTAAHGSEVEEAVADPPVRESVGPVQFPSGLLTEAPPPPYGIEPISVPAYLSAPEARYQVLNRPEDFGPMTYEKPQPASGRPLGKGYPLGPVIGSTADATPVSDINAATADIKAPPALSQYFAAIDFVTNAANCGNNGFIPPDPIAAAGPNHVVNVVNSSVQAYNKTGGAPVLNGSLAGMFSAESPLTWTFDPKVIYDQYEDRYLIVTLEKTDVVDGDPADTSRIFVAVSATNNPLGTWYTTQIPSKINISGTDTWADYPGFAVDEEAVYINCNQFGFKTTGGAYGGIRLWIINKGTVGGFYAGSGASVSIYDPIPGGYYASTHHPAHTFGTPPAGEGTILVMYQGLTSVGSEFVQAIRVTNPLTGPTFIGQFVSLGDIDNTSVAMPDAPQLTSAYLIETNNRRSLHAVWRSSSLWLTTTVVPNSGPDMNQATAHWMELDTSNLSAFSSLQQGDVGGEDISTGTYTYFPSIAVNSSGVAAISFSASSSSIYAGSYYTHRLPGDASGSTSGSGLLTAGTDWYYRTYGAGSNRWGDYTGTSVDPSDQCFWIFNQHAMSRGTPWGAEDGRWATSYGKFCAPVATLDFGDAPDLPYPTMTASGGAAHNIVPGVELGLLIDAEFDGQPDATATGDDLLDGSDDEDGITFTTPLIPNQPGCVDVYAGAAGGLLDAWIDFDMSGMWGDGPGEQIFASIGLAPGLNSGLCFAVPGGLPGPTFARFRVSTIGGLLPTGVAPDGEVEDYQVSIEEELYDWGDAPEPPYQTTMANNGAFHPIVPGFELGMLIDADIDGQPEPMALGDDLLDGNDDEDGIIFTTALVTGQQACFDAIAGAYGGFLDAWIDFDGSGVWGDGLGELIVVAMGLAPGLNPGICFSVPPTALVGPSFARFRLSSAGGLPPTGPAPDGEVEDYWVDILDPTADLGITKTDSPDPVDADTTLIYTVTVSNAGPQDAVGVVVTDTLPAGVSLVSTTGCAEDPIGVPTCTLGAISASGNAQYTITVVTAYDTMGTIFNSASVSATTFDPDPSNNSISEGTTVQAPRIAVAPGTISSSQNNSGATYHDLGITNNGNAALVWDVDEAAGAGAWRRAGDLEVPPGTSSTLLYTAKVARDAAFNSEVALEEPGDVESEAESELLHGLSEGDLAEVESWKLMLPDCASPEDVSWLSLAPISGSTAAGATTTVTTTLDSTGMLAGSYSATLCVNSDDPTNPLVTVPVSLTVLTDGSIDGTVSMPVRSDDSGTAVQAWSGPTVAGSDTTDSNGDFTIDLAAGTYDVFVEAAEHLDSERLGEVVTVGALVLPTVTLLAGDAVEDDEITVVDVTFIASRYGATPGDPQWDPAADITNNDEVDLLDVTSTASNYGNTSPVPW